MNENTPISPELVDQAPERMPEIVRSMHATAAKALDDAAAMLEHEMQSHIQLMRDEANALRTQGDSQASTIEALSVLIRDTHKAFKVQADRLASFRAGEREDAEKIFNTGSAVGPAPLDVSRRIEEELSKPQRG